MARETTSQLLEQATALEATIYRIGYDAYPGAPTGIAADHLACAEREVADLHARIRANGDGIILGDAPSLGPNGNLGYAQMVSLMTGTPPSEVPPYILTAAEQASLDAQEQQLIDDEQARSAPRPW
jgi:hypothetical protein